MTFQVRLTDEAAAKVQQIQDWIAERSPAGAEKWLDALGEALLRLKQRGPAFDVAPESNWFPEPLRQILFRTRKGHTYRALFVVHGENVHVVIVRGFGQDLVSPADVVLPD